MSAAEPVELVVGRLYRLTVDGGWQWTWGERSGWCASLGGVPLSDAVEVKRCEPRVRAGKLRRTGEGATGEPLLYVAPEPRTRHVDCVPLRDVLSCQQLASWDDVDA